MHKLSQGANLEKNQEENGDFSGKLAAASTVKLNVNAQEFVPRFKRVESTEDEAVVDLNENEQIRTNLSLPWKGFPKKYERCKVPNLI